MNLASTILAKLDINILPIHYFYRNRKGDITHDGTVLDNDIVGLYGSHKYKATWIK